MASSIGLAWKLDQMARERLRASDTRTREGAAYERGFAEGLRLAAAELREFTAAKFKARKRKQRAA